VLAASILRTMMMEAASTALMTEAASTSEASVSFYQTTRSNNPQDSLLCTLNVFLRVCKEKKLPQPSNLSANYKRSCSSLKELLLFYPQAWSRSSRNIVFLTLSMQYVNMQGRRPCLFTATNQPYNFNSLL
jgi:hypothetical protein